MKILQLTVVLFLFFTTIISCDSDDEVISLTSSVQYTFQRATEAKRTKILAYDTVRFTSILTNIDSCIWDFGDGNSSKELVPKHVYSEPGEYEVSLQGFFNGKIVQKNELLKVYSLKAKKIALWSIYSGMPLPYAKIEKAPAPLELIFSIDEVSFENNSTKKTQVYVSNKFTAPSVPSIDFFGDWFEYTLTIPYEVAPVHNSNTSEKFDFYVKIANEGMEPEIVNGLIYGYYRSSDENVIALFSHIPYQSSFENDEYYCIGLNAPHGEMKIFCEYE